MKREQSETDKNISTESSLMPLTANENEKKEETFRDCGESRVTSSELTIEKRDRKLETASIICIAFVYVQFSMLLLMIGLSSLKVGLLFMLICVTAIAYTLLKVCFHMITLLRSISFNCANFIYLPELGSFSFIIE